MELLGEVLGAPNPTHRIGLDPQGFAAASARIPPQLELQNSGPHKTRVIGPCDHT